MTASAWQGTCIRSRKNNANYPLTFNKHTIQNTHFSPFPLISTPFHAINYECNGISKAVFETIFGENNLAI